MANNDISGLVHTRNIANHDAFHIRENVEIARSENTHASGVYGMSSKRNTQNTDVIDARVLCVYVAWEPITIIITATIILIIIKIMIIITTTIIFITILIITITRIVVMVVLIIIVRIIVMLHPV